MWEVREERAIGTWGGVQLELVLTEPSRGIVAVQLSGRSLPISPILGLELPGPTAPSRRNDGPGRSEVEISVRPLRDAYVRGDDLIVTYEETADQIRTQVDWRLLPASNWAPWGGIEMVLSVQTQSLDSRPRAEARSGPAASEARNPCPGVCLFRLSSDELSYVEMSGPADVERTVTDRRENGASRFDHITSFDLGRLEKGVIRRCRRRAYWLPRDGDEHAALRLWDDFQASPLPLTV